MNMTRIKNIFDSKMLASCNGESNKRSGYIPDFPLSICDVKSRSYSKCSAYWNRPNLINRTMLKTAVQYSRLYLLLLIRQAHRYSWKWAPPGEKKNLIDRL